MFVTGAQEPEDRYCAGLTFHDLVVDNGAADIIGLAVVHLTEARSDTRSQKGEAANTQTRVPRGLNVLRSASPSLVASASGTNLFTCIWPKWKRDERLYQRLV